MVTIIKECVSLEKAYPRAQVLVHARRGVSFGNSYNSLRRVLRAREAREQRESERMSECMSLRARGWEEVCIRLGIVQLQCK